MLGGAGCREAIPIRGNGDFLSYGSPRISATILPQPGPCIGIAPQPPIVSPDALPIITVVTFTHSVQTKTNAVKFAHQSLCNLKISTLLKAVRKGFVKGCTNMTESLVLKYLNPSPAMAKSHMKCPRHGIQSTQLNTPTNDNVPMLPVAKLMPPILPIINDVPIYPSPAYHASQGPNAWFSSCVVQNLSKKSLSGINPTGL
jgi:hypothetical protein